MDGLRAASDASVHEILLAAYTAFLAEAEDYTSELKRERFKTFRNRLRHLKKFRKLLRLADEPLVASTGIAHLGQTVWAGHIRAARDIRRAVKPIIQALWIWPPSSTKAAFSRAEDKATNLVKLTERARDELLAQAPSG